MAEPTSDPTFATDALYATDGDSWQTTAPRVDPGAPRLAEGFEPDTLPAQWLNWILGVHGDHIQYLDDVVAGLDEITTVSRTIVISGTDFQLAGTSGQDWSDLQAGTAWSLQNSALATLDLRKYIRHGAVITSIKALVDPGAARAGANRMHLRLQRRTPTFGGTPTAPAAADDVAATYDDTTAALQTIDATGLSITMDSTIERILTVGGGNDAGTNNDQLHAVEIQFDDPGPRNF